MTSESFGVFPLSTAAGTIEEFNLPSPTSLPEPSGSPPGTLLQDDSRGQWDFASISPTPLPPLSAPAAASTPPVRQEDFPSAPPPPAMSPQEPMQHSSPYPQPGMPLTLHYPPASELSRPQPAFHTCCYRLVPNYAQQPPVLSWVAHTHSQPPRNFNPFYHGQLQRGLGLPPYPATPPYPQQQGILAGQTYPFFPQGVYAGIRRRGTAEFSAGVYGDMHGNWPVAGMQHAGMQRPMVMARYPNLPHVGRGMSVHPRQYSPQHYLPGCGHHQPSPLTQPTHSFAPALTSSHSPLFQRPQFHSPPFPPAVPRPQQFTPSPQHNFVDLTRSGQNVEKPIQADEKAGECSYTSWEMPPSQSKTTSNETQQAAEQHTTFSPLSPDQEQSLPSKSPQKATMSPSDCGIIRPKPIYPSPRKVIPGQVTTEAPLRLPMAPPIVTSNASSLLQTPEVSSCTVSSPLTLQSVASASKTSLEITDSPIELCPSTLPSKATVSATSCASPRVASRSKSTTRPAVVKRKPQRATKSASVGRKPRGKATAKQTVVKPAASTPTPVVVVQQESEEDLDVEIGEQVVEVETSADQTTSAGSQIYKDFADSFKACRMRLGYSFEAVVQQVRIRYGLNILLADLVSLEKLTLPVEKCGCLVDVLQKWIEDIAKAAGESSDSCTTTKLSTTTTSIYPQRARKYLETEFGRKKNPTSMEMQKMAQFLGVEKDVVRTWFANRRKEEKCLGKRPMGKRREVVRKSLGTPNTAMQAGQAIPSSHYSITVEVPSIHPRDIGTLSHTIEM